MISVIIATFNGVKYLTQQLESIMTQEMKADEVIISDDCSTDDTVGLCHSFIEKNRLSNWRIIENSKNIGYCMNFYKAIREARGDYIFLCDQDDVWDKNKISVMAGIMGEHNDISMLSCRYRLINAEGQTDSRISVPHFISKFNGTLEKISAESLIGHSYIRGCSMCIRASVKGKICDIDLRDLLGHDWQIAMLSALSGGAAVLNKALMSYRCHSDNASFSSKPIRRIEKRISGLKQSVAGHKYILELSRDAGMRKEINSFIQFEEKRLKFLNKKNFFTLAGLIFYLHQYNRYYSGRGIKVWLGDFFYAYKK